MSEENDRLTLVGYGTLLWPPSVEHTLGTGASDTRAPRPVVVRGFRRLFNLRPDHYASSLLWGRPGVEQAGMNVEPAAGAWLNGLAFRVTAAEMELLDRREYAYDRVEVETRDFESGAPLETGFIYSASRRARWIERDPDELLPLWRDVVWARAGAYGIARRFGLAFDRTTYLADGKTLVAERYRGHLSPGQPPRPEAVRRASH